MSKLPAVLSAVLLCTPAASHAQHRADSTFNFGLKQLAIGAAGTAAIMLVLDRPIARNLETGTSANTLQFDRQLDRFGDETGTIPILGGVALAGLITGKSATLRAALHAAESAALADLLVQIGKYGVGRTRPSGDPDLDGFDFHSYNSMSPALPSGHSANAFALATSLGDASGKKWVKVGLYAFATGTAWARLSERQHWLSDVLAGAAVGIGSAKFVSGRMHIFGLRAPRFIVGPNALGLATSF